MAMELSCSCCCCWSLNRRCVAMSRASGGRKRGTPRLLLGDGGRRCFTFFAYALLCFTPLWILIIGMGLRAWG
ncbi:hypothetical protein BJY04DRAFT_189601 [Aspergillus karnatakaensis]|uniref:uncharacterized protein n=1 Tax=Aspergillus karnatakaensis TaxID=1810916 RepID=UPI003CCDBA5E